MAKLEWEQMHNLAIEEWASAVEQYKAAADAKARQEMTC